VKQETLELKEGCLNILLVLGVNGVGKTTSIAKVANYFLNQGKKVMLAAGDTFRAAATEQLTKWAAEMNIPIVKQGEGADPASVVFDAVDSAQAKKIDLLIVDTAGRLHNKKNLMEELKKIYRIIENKGGCERRNMLVIDSTTGQNAYSQAEAFKEAVGVNLVMLTKYDAMSKGGIVFQISHRLGLPFSFVGTGEKRENIAPFNTKDFIAQIFK
ncbi:MAG: signal recognition particle-docking protein FtsY, partial [Spirochaetales bacterium]|nr:signal recognition particle-docking protein FtsY [Spirochaetales bacterium]